MFLGDVNSAPAGQMGILAVNSSVLAASSQNGTEKWLSGSTGRAAKNLGEFHDAKFPVKRRLLADWYSEQEGTVGPSLDERT